MRVRDYQLQTWTVYRRPRDLTKKYAARLFIGEQPTDKLIVNDDIDVIREELEHMGLIPIARDLNDDPVIVETWI